MAQYTSEQAKAAYEEDLAKGIKYSYDDAQQVYNDPDFFMNGIRVGRQAYATAKANGDKTGMENARTGLERERNKRGYSTIPDGSVSTAIEGPLSYQMPSFQYGQQDAYNQALGKVTNREEYTNPYQAQYDDKLNNILNQANWNYNSDNDQAYQAAKKAYLREADRATANTMGQAAAANGGMVSTANMTAAQQAGDYYRGQLNDNLANFIEADYGRYRDNVADQYNQLAALQSADANAYQKYIDSVGLDFDTLNALMSDRGQQFGEYESNRNFGYGRYTDQLSYETNKKETEAALEANDVNDMYKLYDAYMEQGNTSMAAYILQLISEKKGITPSK